MNGARVLLATLLAAALPVIAAGPSAAGQLDSSFGTGGVVRFDPAVPTLDVANAIHRDFQNTLFVAGSSGDRFAVARLGSDYTNEQRTTLDFGAPSVAYGVVQNSDALVAAGTAGGDFAVAWFDSGLEPYDSFGTHGRVRTSFGPGTDAVARAVTAANGFVAAGSVNAGQGGSVALARYNSTGLDPSFGAGGKVVDDVTPGDDAAYAATDDGSIVVAGKAGGAALLARYLPDGTPDPSFGTGGHVVFDLSPGDDVAYAVAEDFAQGSRPFGYLVAGAAGSQAFVARFLGNGAPDTSFGVNGVLRTNLGGLTARFTGISVFAYPSQYALSGVVTGLAGTDAVAAKITPDGTLDPAFGTGGFTVTDLGSTADVAAGISAAALSSGAPGAPTIAVAGGDGADMVIASFDSGGAALATHHVGFGTPVDDTVGGSVRLADGKTLVAGNRSAGGPFLARFLPDGTPDATFGPHGVVDPALGNSARMLAVAVTADGHVLVLLGVGGLVLARFGPDGRLDTSYGSAGFARLGSSANGLSGSIVLLPDGRALVTLGANVGRVTAAGQVDTTFSGDGWTSVGTDAQLLPEPDGSVLAFDYDAAYCQGLRAQRILADGTDTFGWCGARRLRPTSVLRRPDGRILVAGTTGTPDYQTPLVDTLVGGYLPSGAADPSWGGVGVVRVDTGEVEQRPSLAAGPGGTFLVATQTSQLAAFDRPAMARLLGDGRPDRSFATGGWAAVAVPSDVEAVAVQADGKPVLTVELFGDPGRDIGLVRYSPAGTAAVAARSWGWNGPGTLGNGTLTDSRVAVAPAGLTNVRQLAAGYYHSVALLDDGSVWTWGWDGAGALGTMMGRDSAVPARVEGIPPAVAVSAGAYHTLALGVDGSVWAWGWNSTGQLGNGTTTMALQPVRVPIDNVAAIAAGAAHSLALRYDGTVWAWGWNAAGQLGDGTATDRLVPTQVYGGQRFAAIAAGGIHSLAIGGPDGTVYAWGWNGVGQLGAGQPGDAWIPYRVPGLSGVTAIGAGLYHSLAVTNDGRVWAWGWNVLGQLGDGTTTTEFSPVVAPGLSGIRAVTGGAYHSLALAADGTVWTWGWNGYGQLGDGTLTDRWSPVRATRIVDATAIAGSAAHSLAG